MFLNCCDAKKDISGIKSALILKIFNCYLFSYISSVKIKGEKKKKWLSTYYSIQKGL